MMNVPRILGCGTTRRLYSIKPNTSTLTALTNRSIIKLSGFHVYHLLQGLVTNDMRHLELRSGSMYTMFLNSKGRILFDTIMYKMKEVDTLLIDCDTACLEPLVNHLKMYKLRKKVDISVDDSRIYALYDPKVVDIMHTGPVIENDPDSFKTVWMETIPDKSSKKHKYIAIYHDPRIPILGYRIIVPKDTNVEEVLPESYSYTVDPDMRKYRWFRYSLGVGEGADDLPSNSSTPLEYNCDYLHGVCFFKGCYIGQELTARTYHVGVVRKRLMPLYFDKVPTSVPADERINSESGNLGKLRGIEGNVGLGLLRIANVLNLNEIPIGDGIARTLKPIWWPVEASKYRDLLKKN